MLIFFLAFIFAFLTSFSSIAAEMVDTDGKHVPPRMAPYTIIEYKTDTQYTILQGGPTNLRVNDNGLTPEEQAVDNARIADLKNDLGIVKFTKTSIVPVAGLVVYYDGNGHVSDHDLPYRTTKSIIEGTVGDPGPWGEAYTNYLIISDTTVTGRGRITTFEDSIGTHMHELEIGDCATAKDHDNPWNGTVLKVSAIPSDGGYVQTYDLKKYDIGSLDDAVLDIWKETSEYWGYKYVKNQTSIPDGKYVYTR